MYQVTYKSLLYCVTIFFYVQTTVEVGQNEPIMILITGAGIRTLKSTSALAIKPLYDIYIYICRMNTCLGHNPNGDTLYVFFIKHLKARDPLWFGCNSIFEDNLEGDMWRLLGALSFHLLLYYWKGKFLFRFTTGKGYFLDIQFWGKHEGHA